MTLNLKKRKEEERVAWRRVAKKRAKGAQKRRKFAGAVFCFSGAQPRNSAEVQRRAGQRS